MKCPECGKELNLKLDKCSNCGFPIEEIKMNEKEAEKKENKKEKEVIKKEKLSNEYDDKVIYEEIKNTSKNNTSIIDFIISGVFTFVLILFLGVIKTISSLHSGDLTFFQMLKWCLCRALNITYSTANYFIIVIVLFLGLGFILSALRKTAATVVSCVGYLLFALALGAFGIVMSFADRDPNYLFYIAIILTIGWIIYLIVRKDKTKEKVIKIEKHVSTKSTYVNEIKEAKKMLDEGTITEEEFKLLKNKIINKE